MAVSEKMAFLSKTAQMYVHTLHYVKGIWMNFISGLTKEHLACLQKSPHLLFTPLEPDVAPPGAGCSSFGGEWENS